MRVCDRRGQSAIQALSLWPAGLGLRPSSLASLRIEASWPRCAASAASALRSNSSVTALTMSDSSALARRPGRYGGRGSWPETVCQVRGKARPARLQPGGHHSKVVMLKLRTLSGFNTCRRPPLGRCWSCLASRRSCGCGGSRRRCRSTTDEPR